MDGGRQLRFEFFPAKPRPAREDSDSESDHGRRISGLLSMVLPQPVDVVFTKNRSTMVSQRSRSGRLEVRLHRMFRLADDDVLTALARFLGRGDRLASRRLDRFITAHRDEIDKRTLSRGRATGGSRRPAAERRSAVHDLEDVLGDVVTRYFGGEIDVRIRWARAVRRHSGRVRTRTRALATYCFEDSTIRVNPVLDSHKVPRFVVEWIVFHELLHHVLPVEREGSRNRYHTDAFRAFERGFERYEEAKRWEEENLEWILG
jgi:hypothetical protein